MIFFLGPLEKIGSGITLLQNLSADLKQNNLQTDNYEFALYPAFKCCLGINLRLFYLSSTDHLLMKKVKKCSHSLSGHNDRQHLPGLDNRVRILKISIIWMVIFSRETYCDYGYSYKELFSILFKTMHNMILTLLRVAFQNYKEDQ